MSQLPPNSVANFGQSEAGEFSPDEQSTLIKLAHESIASELEHREISSEPSTAHFAELRGVFTTLYLRGELRGCVGYAAPTQSLHRAVIETARAAAFEDGRFRPVTQQEVPELQIELSILSKPKEIAPEAIEIGRHGLLISMAGRRGLLLPQVPIEHNWDRITFLEQTCRKAGLPRDAWQKGALIHAFTAEVFGEKAEAIRSSAAPGAHT
jgi:AmmeMemoRadiSam system protein A